MSFHSLTPSGLSQNPFGRMIHTIVSRCNFMTPSSRRQALVLPRFEHVEAILNFGRSLAEEESARKLTCLSTAMRASRAQRQQWPRCWPKPIPEKRRTGSSHCIVELRPQAWPNSRLIGFADELLGREGRLSAALCRLYAQRLSRQPETEHYMRRHGRGREVDMAGFAA
jgi:hypothetical protein